MQHKILNGMNNIPKVCHFIWTSKSPLSLLQLFSVISFHRYNPNWQIILYLIKQTPAELGANTYVPDYTGPDYFDEIRKLNYIEIKEVDLVKSGIGTDKHGILASDIMRVRALHLTGGVYSDFDMLWLRPMSEFKNIACIGDPTDFEATACFYEFTKGHHNNSNIISEKGSPYILSIIQEQNNIRPPYNDYQAFNSSLLNRKYPNLNSIVNSFPRVLAIDYKTFYPYSTFEMERLFIYEDMKPIEDSKVMGVHWFNGNRLSKIYVNNGSFWDCSMTTLLKTEHYI